MLTQDQIHSLKAPFPSDALSPDTSRGFELTSIKAAYVIERLNDVFGVCGSGWRYAHTPFELLTTPNGITEIVTEVALQYRLPADQEGSPAVIWEDERWTSLPGLACWSQPILASGGKSLGKGGAPYTDARKSAVTDGLTKAASMLGIGHQVFKGLVRTHSDPGSQGQQRGGNGHDSGTDSTAFWALYHREGKPAGVSPESAKDLAARGNWASACTQLRTLIDQASVTVR